MLLSSRDLCNPFRLLGWFGVYLVDASLIITLLGVCVTYLIACAQLLSGIPIIQSSFSFNQLTLLSALLVYPFSSVRNVGILASISLWGIGFLVVSVLILFCFGVFEYGEDLLYHEVAGLPYWPASCSGLTSYIGSRLLTLPSRT
jgi:amino acid permease